MFLLGSCSLFSKLGGSWKRAWSLIRNEKKQQCLPTFLMSAIWMYVVHRHLKVGYLYVNYNVLRNVVFKSFPFFNHVFRGVE
jgi:hypothetical protein